MYTVYEISPMEFRLDGLRAEGDVLVTVHSREEALAWLRMKAIWGGVGVPDSIEYSVETVDGFRYYVWPRQ